MRLIFALALWAAPAAAMTAEETRAAYLDIMITYSLADSLVADCTELVFHEEAEVLVPGEVISKLAAEGYDVASVDWEHVSPGPDEVLGRLLDWLSARGETDLAAVDPCRAARFDIAGGTQLGKLLDVVE